MWRKGDKRTSLIQGLANNLLFAVGKSVRNGFQKNTFTLSHIMHACNCQALLEYYKEIVPWAIIK
jgi:hypothetical protein